MAKYHNIEFTRKVGAKVQKERKHLSLEIEDVAEMAGFHRNVIVSIENGSNTDISHIAAVAFALGLYPKVLLDVDIEIKPRFKLSGTRREKSRLTARLNESLNNGFFDSERTAKEVHEELIENYPNASKVDTKSISVILKRLQESGKLVISKKGNSRYNVYKRKK